jgi:hypothetical protein
MKAWAEELQQRQRTQKKGKPMMSVEEILDEIREDRV